MDFLLKFRHENSREEARRPTGAAPPFVTSSTLPCCIMRSQQPARMSRRATSPAVVHSPLASASDLSFALDDHLYQPIDNKPRLQRSSSSHRRRSSSSKRPGPEPEPELCDAATSTSPPRLPAEAHAAEAGGRSRLVSCASRAFIVVLLLALVAVSLSCVALFAALVSTSKLPTMPNLFDDAVPIRVESPCMPTWMPPEEPMALPAPVRCRFSFLRLRCAPAAHCLTAVHLFPLPHAKCSMRPWHVTSEVV